jgi:calcyphosin
VAVVRGVALIKSQLVARGSTGFLGMSRNSRIMDDDSSQTLSKSEFKKGLQDSAVLLDDKTMKMLFHYFDSNQDGTIRFEEFLSALKDPLNERICRIWFLSALKDPLNERRRKAVEAVFAVMDVDGSGEITAQELMQRYDASRHPEVMAGLKTPQAVLQEFLDTFEVTNSGRDGNISKDEFINYYPA